MVVELAEKSGLIAAAALLAVLFPPLRGRLLGVGRPPNWLAALALGLALSIWGGILGPRLGGEHINVRAIGVLVAAILGGPRAGAIAGLGGGLFYATVVDEETAPWVLLGSVSDGLVAGWVAQHRPQWFHGGRTFVTATGIQAIHVLIVGVGLFAMGDASRYLPAWPAHGIKLVVNAVGVTLFVVVARLIVAREEAAVALVRARAEANAAALEALRRKLEPHFLFNALNTIRAAIRTAPDQARELVADLADLYRYVLAHPVDATLADEVGHACAYLAIERARLGSERLIIETDLPKELGEIRVPALLLQPLVENAIRHGVAVHELGGTVRISATRNNTDQVVVSIAEKHLGTQLGSPESGHGIGLETLRQRLERELGDRAHVDLTLSSDGSTATLVLPIKSVPK